MHLARWDSWVGSSCWHVGLTLSGERDRREDRDHRYISRLEITTQHKEKKVMRKRSVGWAGEGLLMSDRKQKEIVEIGEELIRETRAPDDSPSKPNGHFYQLWSQPAELRRGLHLTLCKELMAVITVNCRAREGKPERTKMRIVFANRAHLSATEESESAWSLVRMIRNIWLTQGRLCGWGHWFHSTF